MGRRFRRCLDFQFEKSGYAAILAFKAVAMEGALTRRCDESERILFPCSEFIQIHPFTPISPHMIEAPVVGS